MQYVLCSGVVRMLKWNWWSFYWIFVWFGLGFGIPEGYALATDPRNTLSYQVWHLEGFGLHGLWQNPLHWSAGHYFIAVGMIWLLGHFVGGIWR